MPKHADHGFMHIFMGEKVSIRKRQKNLRNMINFKIPYYYPEKWHDMIFKNYIKLSLIWPVKDKGE